VFLSYSRKDEVAARAVRDIIEKAGYPVWYDRMIPGGERFEVVTSKALDDARAVVVLWTAVSVQSDWVKDEASAGRVRQCLVPLSLDGSEPPLGFRQVQFLDLSQEGIRADGPEMRRALHSIGALLGSEPVIQAEPQRKAALWTGRRTLIAGGGLLVLGGGIASWKFLAAPGPGLKNSIAVLPFDNLSGDPQQQYLPDGLAAELRSRLSRNPLLSVVGQVSSNEFRGNGMDSQAIARKLSVAYLLTGNVRVFDAVVRIAVELIEGSSGFSKWSDTFERPLDNILRLQEEIAESVGARLGPQLAAGGKEPARRSGETTSVAAFDAYLRGRDLFESQIDEASDRAALARFTEAATIDPGYAAARAARSRTLAVIANQYVQSAERKRLYREAVSEARRAVSDAAEFPDAYAALGYALLYGELDVAAAEAPYAKAREYGAGNADVLSRYALYRARRRQFDDAIPAIERATALDPLNPSVFKTAGLIRFVQGDYTAAIAAARHALAINPQRATLHGDIGNALLMQDRIDAAEAEFNQEHVGLLALPGKAIVALRRNDESAAAHALEELVKSEGDNGLYQQAQVLAQWGRTDEALDALAKAHAEQDAGLVYLMGDPFLKPLAKEPQFKSLLASLHFV
jgi:TolB-like protein/Flp pilus assembly protein TadD